MKLPEQHLLSLKVWLNLRRFRKKLWFMLTLLTKMQTSRKQFKKLRSIKKTLITMLPSAQNVLELRVFVMKIVPLEMEKTRYAVLQWMKMVIAKFALTSAVGRVT